MASINVNNLPAKAAAAITTADQVMTFTASGDTTQTPFNEAVAQANTLNLINSVKTVKITIPTAQVLTLYTTPVAFGLTVPVGYFVQPLSIQCGVDFNTVAYATNTSLSVRAVGADVAIGASGATALAATISKIFNLDTNINTTAGQTQFIDGVDLEVFVGIGNPTAGDSNVDVYMTYTLVEL
jgi:hypothetical protein